MNETAKALLNKVQSKQATVGVIGLGYVGLPLMIEFAKAGLAVIGFDIDQSKVDHIDQGTCYIKHFPDEVMRTLADDPKVRATTDFSLLAEVDAILICVPTPLTEHREPDLQYIEITSAAIAPHLRAGHLVVLESTTYPGTTKEVMKPLLDESGLVAGDDYFLAYSPEREDPGNKKFSTSGIPKVVGGYDPASKAISCALYEHVVPHAVPVSSCDAAEATKLLENIFRSVNIALVNELKVVFDRMGIDVFEVINAASTKPFGYMPFYPGPGLGGHCIPIDPFYLTWRARKFDIATRFIELAGEINTAMPEYVVTKVMEALNEDEKSMKGSRVLLMGMAYKSNVDDMRESPSLRLVELLQEKGANVVYHDPHVPHVTPSRHYDFDMKSVELTPEEIAKADVVLISTKHEAVDQSLLAEHAGLIVDTRNAMVDLTDQIKGRLVKA